MKRIALFSRISLLLLLACVYLLSSASTAFAYTSPQTITDSKSSVHTGSAGIAWGDPDGTHPRYSWPFPFDQMGHLISSYQNYSSNLNDAYFHHGIDMIAPDGTAVRTPVAGQVVNVEMYGSNHLYWEVAILDPDGYVWQYHHIAQASIPQSIHTAFAAWEEDEVNGGFIAANSHLGDIVTWPVFSFGYYFHHIHLNILAAGDIYLNPLDFLDNTYVDTQAPQIQNMGLFTGTNNLLEANTIPYGTPYSVYLKTRDLFMSQVYYLPPQWITYRINDGESKTLWNFKKLPGGASNTDFVNAFYLPTLTQGNYEEREFYINMGFTTDGINPLPTDPGLYKMYVEVFDSNYNKASWTHRWSITQSLPDNGCATGQSIQKTYIIDENVFIEDIDLGVVIEHDKRGEVRVSLKGPMDSAPTVLIANDSDNNKNYNLLIDDASSEPINNNSRDNLRPPFFDRSAGPSIDGSLDRYNGMNAIGVWELSVCDNKIGTEGQVWDLDLRLVTTDNRQPIADAQSLFGSVNQNLPVTLTGSDPDGSPITFHVTANPQHGSLSGTPPNLIYKPDVDFYGVDQFSFKVNDGRLDSDLAIISITITPNLYLPLILTQR